jgi:hypothetical protein
MRKLLGGGRWTVVLALAGIAAFAWPAGAEQGSRGGGEPTLSVEGPSEPVVADWRISVATAWSTEAPQALSVVLLRAASCGVNLAAGLRRDAYGIVLVDAAPVTGSGRRVDEGNVTTTGSYLICGYLQSRDPTAPAHVVVQAPRRLEVTAHPDSRATPRSAGTVCGSVGGPREITRVRAYNVSCRAARSLARRWGRAGPRPARVGDYSCGSRGESATCTASGGRRVTFEFDDNPKGAPRR